MTDSSDQPERLVPSWLDNLAALGWRVIAAIPIAIIVAVILAAFVLRMRDAGRSRGSAAMIA